MLSLGEMETNNNNNNSETAFECQCGKQFKRKAPYQRHLEIAHSDPEQHRCKVCAKTFGNASTLTMHMTVHENQQPFDQSREDKKAGLLRESKEIGQMVAKEVDNMNMEVCVGKAASPTAGETAEAIVTTPIQMEIQAAANSTMGTDSGSTPFGSHPCVTEECAKELLAAVQSQESCLPTTVNEVTGSTFIANGGQTLCSTSSSITPPAVAVQSQSSEYPLGTLAPPINTSIQSLATVAPVTAPATLSQPMPMAAMPSSSYMNSYSMCGSLPKPICSVPQITSSIPNHNGSGGLPNGQVQGPVTIKQEPLSSDSEDGTKACYLTGSQPNHLGINCPDKLFGVNGGLSHGGIDLDSEEEGIEFEEGFEDDKLTPLRKSSRARMANPVWKSLLTGQVYEDILNNLDGSPEAKRARLENASDVKVEDIGGVEVVKSENTENRDPDFLDLDQEQVKKSKKPRNRKPKAGGPLKPSHTEEGDGGSSFACYVCGKKFLTEKYLSMHISLHGTVKSTDELLVSEAIAGKPNSVMPQTEEGDPEEKLKKNKKGGKVNVDGGWTCKICSKSFAHNSGYKNHMRTHSNERPYVCKICDIGFKEKYHLKKHNLFIHSTELPEKCRFCGKRFKDSTAVRAHERIHSDARPFACRRCSKTFKTSECLWHHEHRSKSCGEALGDNVPKERIVRRRRRYDKQQEGDMKEEGDIMDDIVIKKEIDTGEFDAALAGQLYGETGYYAGNYSDYPEYPDYPEYCLDLDGDTQEGKADVPKVVVVKQEEMSQSCPAWEEDEDLEEALFATSHPDLELVPGSQEFKCKMCKKNFLDLASFQKHSKIHTEERPFICTKCDIGFKMKVHLKKHNLYVHSNEYPCECKFCGKRFKDSSAVKLHERTHSDIRPFQCTGCGKAFKTRENLWGHQHRGKCMASKGNMEDGPPQQPPPPPPPPPPQPHSHPTAQASVYGNGVSAQAVVGNNQVTAQACVSNNQVTARAVIENNQITAHASFANNQVTAHASLVNNQVTAHATVVNNNQVAAQASVGNVKIENTFDATCMGGKTNSFPQSFSCYAGDMKSAPPPPPYQPQPMGVTTVSATFAPNMNGPDVKTYVNAKNNTGVTLNVGKQQPPNPAPPPPTTLPMADLPQPQPPTTPVSSVVVTESMVNAVLNSLSSSAGQSSRWPTLKEFLSQGVDSLASTLPSSWCQPLDKQTGNDLKHSSLDDCPTIKEHLTRGTFNPTLQGRPQQLHQQAQPQQQQQQPYSAYGHQIAPGSAPDPSVRSQPSHNFGTNSRECGSPYTDYHSPSSNASSSGPIPSFQSTFLSRRRTPPPPPSSLQGAMLRAEDPSIPIIYWDDDQENRPAPNHWQSEQDSMFHDISETVFTQL